MIQHKDAAVSPVVGVMLMLVVTIIIAAIVSAFAGGLAGDQHKTPQANLAVTGVIQSIGGTINPTKYPYVLTYPPGYYAANGLKFENNGGDTFSLNDVAIQLQSEDTTYTLQPTDTPNTTATTTYPGSILTPGITNGGYFQKIGNTSLSDTTIAPGDAFMLYADGNALAVTYPGGSTWSSSTYGPEITWEPVGAAHGFGVYLGTKLQYKVIDKASDRVISSGELYLTQ
jgi:FlaG/FlaF family flagellin (archaellin)